MKSLQLVKHLKIQDARLRLLRYFLVLFLVALVIVALIAFVVFQKAKPGEVFVGVELGYANFEDVSRFVDEVSGYVNLIVIGSLNITTNATRLTAVCDYLYAKGLYFVPFMFLTQHVDNADFFKFAKERWGDRFLGVYLSDEPGGRQFDAPEHRIVDKADNYSDAAQKYVQNLGFAMEYFWTKFGKFKVTMFTADYALYWYDFKAGYDVIFAEFGWNFSRQLHIALCRGAARMQNKDWGVIITWTYREPPYIEDAETLYNDMVLAYNNGAKYILVFNYPTNVTEYGVLTGEHLYSIKKFGDYVQMSPRSPNTPSMAYVLPENGYCFRSTSDQIWGIWETDELSPKIWNEANALVAEHSTNLDIIYETPGLDKKQPYKRIVFWNGTTI